MLMKHIILAQNISISNSGLKDIIKNLDILENSNQKHRLNIKELKNKTNSYLKDLEKTDITISDVDEILDFISIQHKAIFDIFS